MAAEGCPFADSDCNNSAQKCPKDHRGGIVKIVIPLYVFMCFMRLPRPNGHPNDGLEAFLDHLAGHGAHFGNKCAAYLRHDGSKSSSVAPKGTTWSGQGW